MRRKAAFLWMEAEVQELRLRLARAERPEAQRVSTITEENEDEICHKDLEESVVSGVEDRSNVQNAKPTHRGPSEKRVQVEKEAPAPPKKSREEELKIAALNAEVARLKSALNSKITSFKNVQKELEARMEVERTEFQTKIRTLEAEKNQLADCNRRMALELTTLRKKGEDKREKKLVAAVPERRERSPPPQPSAPSPDKRQVPVQRGENKDLFEKLRPKTVSVPQSVSLEAPPATVLLAVPSKSTMETQPPKSHEEEMEPEASMGAPADPKQESDGPKHPKRTVKLVAVASPATEEPLKATQESKCVRTSEARATPKRKTPQTMAELLEEGVPDDSKKDCEAKAFRRSILEQMAAYKTPDEALMMAKMVALKKWGVDGESLRTSVSPIPTALTEISRLWRECCVKNPEQKDFWGKLCLVSGAGEAEELVRGHLGRLSGLLNRWGALFGLFQKRERLREKLRRAAEASESFPLFYKQTFHDWKALKEVGDEFGGLERGSPEAREVEVWGVPAHFLLEVDRFEVGYVQNLKIRAEVRERVRKLAT